jgi:tetratricopeptide (TPR) repeat protein
MAVMRTCLLTIVCLGLAVAPRGVVAQFGGFGGPVTESDLLYLAGEPRQALEILQRYLASDSTDYDALWRAARSAVVIGIEETESRAQNVWLDPALDWSRRASELKPDGIDGTYWLGVSAGRRAMNASPGYAVELAEVTYEAAHAILALDSLHGGAHNMLGKLNYEIMSLSRIKRAIARTFMGNDALSDTSWENAEYHLVRAAQVWPDFVLFQFDVGQLYRKRGRRDEAVAAFVRALDLPSVEPIDRELQTEARAILADWNALPADYAASDSSATSGADSRGR